MGSQNGSFVLGFTPLQLARRPTGMSGTLEPTAGDELTQLQRLIDLGVVSGMTSPEDVVPLEQSEGARRPRNDYELAAQAYMVGNCAHCHNPRGFPTKKAPLLKDVLNFLPSTDGGVFQFPLDRTSPVRARAPAPETRRTTPRPTPPPAPARDTTRGWRSPARSPRPLLWSKPAAPAPQSSASASDTPKSPGPAR